MTATAPATAAPVDLRVDRLDLADIPDCLAIVDRTFDSLGGDARTVARWFDARIAHNPWQHHVQGIGVGVRDGGRMVAFRAMFAQPWWLEGCARVFAFAAHTCVEPAYRGHGLGGRLIAQSRACAELTGSTSAGHITQKVYAKHGFEPIGGAGNDFFRLRASYVGSMRSRLDHGIGRAIGGALGRALDVARLGAGRTDPSAEGYSLVPTTRCGEDFDVLWEAARGGYASCLERSSRYLNWRLFDQPTHPLRLLAVRDRDHRLRGFGIWHELRYSEHVSCAVLRDLFCVRDDESARRAFLALAVPYWRDLGHAWVNLEVAAPDLTALFARARYERIPSIGNRYHVHRPGGWRAATLSDWFRSGLDGDYFDA